MPQIHGKQIRAASIDGDTKLTAAFLATLIRTTGANPWTANQSVGGFKLTSLGDPTAAQDAATKFYVDAVASGLDVKASSRVATAAALPANTASGSGVGKTLTANAVGVLTVDGVATVLNDRILVKDEATGANNGVYKVTTEGTAGVAFVLTRAIDFDQNAEVTAGAFTFIAEGTVNADTGWVLITNDPITVDTTTLTFTQFTGTGAITAGTGLTKTGSTIDFNTGDTSLTVGADSVVVKRDPAGAITLDGGSAGIEVNTDGTSIEISSNALRIASGAAGSGLGYSAGVLSVNTGFGISIVADAVVVNSSSLAGDGLDVTSGAQSALKIKVDATPTAPSIAVSSDGVRAAVPTRADKDMVAFVTAADNQQACAPGIQFTPSGDSYVEVTVNGVPVLLGNGTKVAVEAYFSGDNGTSARYIGAIIAGDKLYWNGTVAGYELASTDRVNFNYVTLELASSTSSY